MNYYSMTTKKLPSLPSSVVSKTCSTLAQCLRQLFERSALSKRPYPTPAVVLGDRQDSIGRETDPSQLSQPAGMPMPMPNRLVCPCPLGRPWRMPPPSFSTDGSWALTKETDQDAAKRCHKWFCKYLQCGKKMPYVHSSQYLLKSRCNYT